MSPWPGTPKSQQTPPINPPSVRFPFTLNEDSTQADVHDAIRTALNGLTVHEQAFANIPAQVAAQASAAATAAVENISSEVVAGVTSFNTRTGPVIYFPGLGTVNNQLGESSYATEQGDAGAKILVGDSGPVTVTLNSGVTLPWFTIIGNDSGASVFLMPDSGSLYGLSELNPGGLAFVFYDGVTFWSEGLAGQADSGMGTTGFIPMWTDPTTLGNSHIDEISVAGADTVNQYLIGIQPAWFGDGTLTAAQLYALNFTSDGVVVSAVGTGAADIVSTATSPTGISWITAVLGAYTDGTAGNSGVELSATNSNFNEGPLYLGDEGQIFIESAASADYPTAIGRVFVNTILAHSTVFSAAGTPLPSAASAGISARAFVSDATAAAFGAPYVSGGTNKVPVYCDGANWFVG